MPVTEDLMVIYLSCPLLLRILYFLLDSLGTSGPLAASQRISFVLLMKSHLQSYPCPLQINSFWNLDLDPGRLFTSLIADQRALTTYLEWDSRRKQKNSER